MLDQEKVEAVKRELYDNANKLDGGSFQDLRVGETIFGGSPKGGELGFHHGRAHQVIADTILGVVADMRDFRDGVIKAEQMLDEADTGAQTDLARERAAVEELENANTWFEGDNKYHHARNNQGGDR